MSAESDMDKQRFKQACEKVIGAPYDENRGKRIGTMGEKTLHAVLKHYFEPMEGSHEIKVGSYIADISCDSGIVEIQTRQFDKLKKKLEHFLSLGVVTVVYPIAATKWLIWLDEQTGEVTKKRKSPKSGSPCEIFRELYQIKHLLSHPNLRLCIVLIDLEEYRYLNGWSKDKKRGSSRCDRIPLDVAEEVAIDCLADYIKLIPEKLNEPFTSKEFRKAAGTTLARAQTALNVLHAVGAVARIGKQGNLYVYEKAWS